MKRSIRRRQSGRKAVGTVVSGLIMVIVLVLSFSAFHNVFKRTIQFEDELLEIHQNEYKKKSEEITVLGNPFTNENHLNLTIVNIGNIPSTINWITIINPTNKKPEYSYYPLDPPLYLDPGDKTEALALNETWIFPGGYNKTKSYIIQVITERGTIADYVFPNPSRENIKGGTELLFIGPFQFKFAERSFTFTSREQNVKQPAWEIVDSEDRITFYIELKNNSEDKIIMNGHSYLSLIIPDQPISNFHEVERSFYLVDINSVQDALISYDSSTPLEIEPDETITIIFASSNPFSSNYNVNNCLRANNEAGTENLVTTFLVLFWEYEGTSETFGLTIPFVSIHIPEY